MSNAEPPISDSAAPASDSGPSTSDSAASVAAEPAPPSLGPSTRDSAKSGVSVGGILVAVGGALVVLVLGFVVVSSMVSTVTRDKPGPEGMVDQICAQPESEGLEELCGDAAGGGDQAGGDVAGGGEEAGGDTVTPGRVIKSDGPEPDLPVTALKPGAELAQAYLQRYQDLLTSEKPGLRVGEIHLQGFAGDRIIALNQKIHDCNATTGVGLVPGQVRTVEDTTVHTLLAVRVTERAPSCVTGTAIDGATDVELDFTRAYTTDGRYNWLLTELHAKPAKPGGTTLFAPVAG